MLYAVLNDKGEARFFLSEGTAKAEADATTHVTYLAIKADVAEKASKEKPAKEKPAKE